MIGNVDIQFLPETLFIQNNSTSFSCRNEDFCTFLSLQLIFSDFDHEIVNNVFDMTIDSYGKQILKILI